MGFRVRDKLGSRIEVRRLGPKDVVEIGGVCMYIYQLEAQSSVLLQAGGCEGCARSMMLECFAPAWPDSFAEVDSLSSN